MNLWVYHCLHLSLFLSFRLWNFDKERRRREKDSQIGLGTDISGKPTTKNPKNLSKIQWEPRHYASKRTGPSVCCKPETSGSNTVNFLKIMTKFISGWPAVKKCILFSLYDVNFKIWIINILCSFKFLKFIFYPRCKN